MSDMSGLQPHTGIDWNNADRTVGVVNYGGADKTHVVFYMDKVHNPAKSMEQGHPIYDNVAFVRIGNPGERLNVVIRPATDVDRRRFALQWAQFTQNAEQRPSGTPISILYPENPAVIGLLEGCNVYTVEQLADLSGNAIETIGMGAQKYVNEAQSYLKNAEKGVKHSQMRAMQEKHDMEVSGLKQQIQELNQTVRKLLSDQKQGNTRQADLAQAGMEERPVHRGAGFDPQSEIIANTDKQMRGAGRPQPAKRQRIRTTG